MVFFFKQKTAYEMRISDWSSDVCSSDLLCTLLRDSENGTKTNRAAIGKLLAASKWTEQFRTFSERFAPSLEGIRLAAERTRLLDMTILRAGDRKSVVQGKSVYVRVDLGGRRIIKTNNRTEKKKK